MPKMFWKHDVSEAWLQARRNVLTATEISKLLPELKRGAKKPGEISLGFAAIWAEKHSDMPLDTGSIGPAARGHIMEPWVVDAYNEQVTAGERFNHWDDCVIVNDLVGFSPDAMDQVQRGNHPKLKVSPDGNKMQAENLVYQSPKRIMEIKCYEPANHMKACITPKMEHKELMQIAVAFHVLPKLQEAKLCFCCPGAPIPMFIEEYTRDDLKEQLGLIKQVVAKYVETAIQCNELSRGYKVSFTEADVYREYMADLIEAEGHGTIYNFG